MKNAALAIAVLGSTLMCASCTDETKPSSTREPSLPDGAMGSSNGSTTAGAADAPGSTPTGAATPIGSEGPTGPVALDNPAAGGSSGVSAPVAETCDPSSLSGTSPNTLSLDLTAAVQPVHKELFGVLMETLGR